jgi:hypothetical protein
MRLTVALLLAGLLLCCYGSRARADVAELALRRMCGPSAVRLAPLVRAEARRNLSDVRLVAIIFTESGCHPDRVNLTTGAVGLLGIMPGRSADPDRLEAAQLLDPATNLHLGASHMLRLISLCGSFAGAAHVYHSKDGKCRNWRGDAYVARLLRMERDFLRWLRGEEARVS